MHLGKEVIVDDREVIGIFDIENTSISKFTKEFLGAAEKNKSVVNVSYEMPKTFVVCSKNGKETVYISQISAATLKKRAFTDIQ